MRIAKREQNEEQMEDFRWFGENLECTEGDEAQAPIDDWQEYDKHMVSSHLRDDPNLLLGVKNSDGQIVRFSMDTSRTRRNLNTLVLGGCGSGKTTRHMIPNILQMNSSVVVTDVSGEIFGITAQALAEKGYRVWKISPEDPQNSCYYNPMDYIYDQEGNIDICKIAVIVQAIMGESEGEDPFWAKSIQALLTFAISYVAEFSDSKERNLRSVYQFLLSGCNEQSDGSCAGLDKLVRDTRRTYADRKCFDYYDIFCVSPPKTRAAIITSAVAALAFASREDCNEAICNIDLKTLGNTKTALFIKYNPDGSVKNILLDILQHQLPAILMDESEARPDHRLPVHVRMYIDEAGNCMKSIRNIENYLATMRRYNFSYCMYFQTAGQMKFLTKDKLSVLVSAADTIIFMGASDHDTVKWLADICSRSGEISPPFHGGKIAARQQSAKDLELTLSKLSSNQCIAIIRGYRPMLLRKLSPVQSEQFIDDAGSLIRKSCHIQDDNEYSGLSQPDEYSSSDIGCTNTLCTEPTKESAAVREYTSRIDIVRHGGRFGPVFRCQNVSCPEHPLHRITKKELTDFVNPAGKMSDAELIYAIYQILKTE